MPGQTCRCRAALVVASLVLSGCTTYQVPPLTATHPAHPDASAVRETPASGTLVYTPADIAAVRGDPGDTASEHGARRARQAEGGPSRTAVGEGEVVAATPSSGQIVLEHGEIKGFMEAMTMGYRTDPPSLLAKVKPGDKVRFTIDVERRAIIELEKLP
jgi:Cu(I)/Ag(I) efflux system periplasmic protein CusF